MSDKAEVTYTERTELEKLMEVVGRCNEPVAAWMFVQPMRCNLPRGHAGDCYHR